MPSDPRCVQPPRLPADLIVHLVEAHAHGSSHLPMFHVDDVMPLLQGNDREYATATTLLDAGKVFYPAGRQP